MGRLAGLITRGILGAKQMILKIEQRKMDNGVAVVELAGRLALGRESGHIEPVVIQAIKDGAKMVVIDLAGVSHIDSTGIGVMAYCYGKAAQAGAELRISGAKTNVFELFQITRLANVIPFFPNLDSAVQGNGRLV